MSLGRHVPCARLRSTPRFDRYSFQLPTQKRAEFEPAYAISRIHCGRSVGRTILSPRAASVLPLFPRACPNQTMLSHFGRCFSFGGDSHDCALVCSATLIRNHFAAPEAVSGTSLGAYLARADPHLNEPFLMCAYIRFQRCRQQMRMRLSSSIARTFRAVLGFRHPTCIGWRPSTTQASVYINSQISAPHFSGSAFGLAERQRFT